ncbi:endolytic transglycosylase MltG [Clostridium sp. WILCCON 0269]|uniref:Endolytic murein transglycosylase n=1 Tax=Candidatus Clostridium eludens TaxID=3381663 RepID=A0ABW8SK73_9CLOT
MVKKNLKSVFLLCSLALIIIIGGILYYVVDNIKYPLKSNAKKISINVKQEENLSQVIDTLSEQGLVKNASVLKWYINKHFGNVKVKQGSYSFSRSITLGEFEAYLKVGIKDDEPVEVLIPEGSDTEHIGMILQKNGVINSADFLESCKNYKLPDFIKQDAKRRYNLEGYLFPDTYKFLKGSSGEDIIKIMLDRFCEVIDEVEKDTGVQMKGQELDRIITMASIVEKEVEKPEERGKAASVFYNRLQKGMKLQSCATVLYALGVHKDKLYYKDLQVDSVYNTYKVNGLPEGPISNPGKGCILAAIKPENTNYLYFVSNNDGTHFFTDDSKKFLQVKEATQGD